MKKLVLGMAICALILSSCGKNSAEYKALKAENDSLKIAHQQTTGNLDEMISILNEVEDNFQKIKTAENYLSVTAAKGGEMTASTRERLESDMQLIAKTLDDNRKKIENLESQLKKSSINSSELKKSIERMRTELNDKTETLAFLQEELAKKDAKIAELSENVSTLSANVSNLSAQNKEQEETISAQQLALSTVYYCFGTEKELKDQRILVKGQLGTDFNKDYFIRIKNAQSLTSIPLYAKKAELISKHPSGTYTITKDENGKVVLNITDVQKFWSLTKYLVIQVNV